MGDNGTPMSWGYPEISLDGEKIMEDPDLKLMTTGGRPILGNHISKWGR